MIDYVKLNIINGDIGQILSNPNLEFKTIFSEKTGLLDTKKVCLYHHCKIVVYDSGLVLFQGSIHKLYNSINEVSAPNLNYKKDYNGFNGNQFTMKEIHSTIKHLENLFNVSSNQMIFQNVEFGQNLTLSFNPQLFIKGLIMYSDKKFDFDYNDFYAQSKHSQYIIKIYNKGNQYGMMQNVLRLELKATKMQCQKKHVGLRTMADVSELTMNKAFEFLVTILERVLYYDNSTKESSLSRVDKTRIKEFSNPRYWERLKPNKRDTKKKLLDNIISNYSNKLKEQLKKQILKNRVMFYREFKDTTRVMVYPSSIGESITPTHIKKRPSFGLDLSPRKLVIN